MNDCIFCNWDKIKDDILFETAHFRVKVGIGIVTAGHVMIVSKQHYRCYAEMPKELEAEYQQLKNRLIKIITKQFAEPFLVEYGVFGQTVPHAHVHLIPKRALRYRIDSIVEELGATSGVPFQVGNFDGLRQLYRQNGGYVFLEEKNQMHLFDFAGKIPNPVSETTLCYRPFFAKLGVGSGKSWKNMTEQDKLLDEQKRNLTKEKLKTAFLT